MEVNDHSNLTGATTLLQMCIIVKLQHGNLEHEHSLCGNRIQHNFNVKLENITEIEMQLAIVT